MQVKNRENLWGGAHGEKWENSWTDRAKFPTKIFPIMILYFEIRVNY